MTRQILAILIVVAIIVVIIRVVMQWGGASALLPAQNPQPTATLLAVNPAGAPLPTALPQVLATAVVATVQAVRGTATPVISSGRPSTFPNTGIADTVDWAARLPFLIFLIGITAVTVVGMWFGRKR